MSCTELDFSPWKSTVAKTSVSIQQFRARYAGRIGRYHHECVSNWKQGEPRVLPPAGFCVEAYSSAGGNLLLAWPTVDLDAALALLAYWKARAGLETIAGTGVLRMPWLAFGDFELDVDDHGRVLVPEYEKSIRDLLRSGWFPEWRYGSGVIRIR